MIKLHRHSGKVSYLVYPDSDTDSHPALLRSVRLSLRTREIDCLEYGASANAPILHRKETFLTTDHPLHAKFARLTEQGDKHGLLDDSATIGTREGWNQRLEERGFLISGHRLIKPRHRNSPRKKEIPDQDERQGDPAVTVHDAPDGS
jgi:DNA phosphorothioation-associated putative methyltransferase